MSKLTLINKRSKQFLRWSDPRMMKLFTSQKLRKHGWFGLACLAKCRTQFIIMASHADSVPNRKQGWLSVIPDRKKWLKSFNIKFRSSHNGNSKKTIFYAKNSWIWACFKLKHWFLKNFKKKIENVDCRYLCRCRFCRKLCCRL